MGTGYKHTEESKKKMSMFQKGRKTSEETKKKLSEAGKGKHRPYFKRKPFSEEHRKKLSEAGKGNKNAFGSSSNLGRKHKHSGQLGREPTLGFTGRRHSDETRRKMSEAHRGEKGQGWRGGITPLAKIIRGSFEYAQWRLLVYKRDNYTCALSGQRGGRLHAHHIKTVVGHPELICDVNNGITLSKECHEKIRGHEEEYIEQFTNHIRYPTPTNILLCVSFL
jgi:hypothetical protein